MINFLNLLVLQSRTMHSGVSWRHQEELVYVQQSQHNTSHISLFWARINWFLYLPRNMCRHIKTEYNTENLFYKVLCMAIWYQSMLTTHGLENSIIWRQPVPKAARLLRCDLYIIHTITSHINTEIN